MPAALRDFGPLLVTAAAVCAVLWAAHVMLIARRRDLGSERLFPRQLVLLALTLVGVISIAAMLPVSDQARGQILGLLGLVISGLFAFSSGTIFANLMSGIMLRVTRPFHTGDFITVGPHFGRVVERGLLDTEIQTESRELIALPNTFLISHPVTVVRSSGAIVSTTLTLGYAVHHRNVEAQLLRAAESCGLSDPFVRILELGNFAVGYRVSGLLADTKGLLTARSELNRSVLDTLHAAGIEILSPRVMSQRPLAADRPVMPPTEPASPQAVAVAEAPAELIVFDKAENAAQADAEAERERLLDQIRDTEHALEGATGKRREELEATLVQARERLAALRGPAPTA